MDSDDYISENLLKDIEPYLMQNIELIKWNPIFVDENKNEILKLASVAFEKVTGEQGFNILFGRDNLIDCLELRNKKRNYDGISDWYIS